MLNNVIDKISNDFINEAISSPNLLADMAAMENYMAESYNGRIFIELLQNADDCDSKQVYVERFGNDIIFANDGKPFDENDVLSISRSGASNKERGKNIGYRGIGFKSTTYLTDEIIIYSNDTYFTFSKKICSQKLGFDINNIPIIRIPILLNPKNDNLCNKVSELKNIGYKTLFIFKNARIETFLEDVSNVNEGDFIFLNSVENCKIKIDTFNFNVILDRIYKDNTQLVTFKTGNENSWLIIKQNNVSLGFKYDVNIHKIIPCVENEQVYHSYLPTFDKVCFPLKINADFSTDPSRKHITVDQQTEQAIENVAIVISELVNLALNSKLSEEFSNLFAILNSFSNFSRFNNTLQQKTQKNIIENVNAPTNTGIYIRINKYKLLPEWLEESEKYFIRINSDTIKNVSYQTKIYLTFNEVDKFISQYSNNQFNNEDIIQLMQEEQLIQRMSPETQGKTLGKIIKSEFLTQKISSHENNLSQIRVLTNNGIKSIDEISLKNIEIAPSVKNALSSNTTNSDLEWFDQKYLNSKRTIFSFTNKHNAISFKNVDSKGVNIKPHISKWRSAEQQCIEIEKSFGNTPSDVSKRNIGYDIESITPDGKTRRIEVKSIAYNGGFSITNNEYTAAHQYGTEYFLCLIFQSEIKIQLIYINDPLHSLNFEKRIKQWEWFCEEYNGESYTFDL